MITADPEQYSAIDKGLATNEFELTWIRDSHEIRQKTQDTWYDLVILTPNLLRMEPDDLIQQIAHIYPSCPILVVAAPDDNDRCKWAFQNGAFNIIDSALEAKEVMAKAKGALQLKKKLDENKPPEQEQGHIINQLKSCYYEIDHIMQYIRTHNMGFDQVAEELQKKERLGQCLFDYLETHSHEAPVKAS